MGGSGTVYLPGLVGFSRKTWHKKFKVRRANKHLNHSWSKNHLETEPDSIQVDRLRAVHVVKALSVGIHSYLLPLLQGFPDVLPPHTLDPKVLELNGHVLVLTWHVGHVHRAHSPLATLPTNCSWAHLRTELKLRKKIERDDGRLCQALRQTCNHPGFGFCSCLVGQDSNKSGLLEDSFDLFILITSN